MMRATFQIGIGKSAVEAKRNAVKLKYPKP